jgi:signal transduction histidine kinase
MNADDKVNILLVDDQPGKLLAYRAMLDELGENLITASSGREALEHLLRTDVTIVLMDVSMPDLDGFELAGIIRDHPRYQKTAIIFVSAVHLTDMDRLKGYASGAVDYVSVPVVPELLRAKVRVFAELYRKTRQWERLNRELESRVEERTAELAESTRRQIELTQQLREADRRKDEFLAFLAHELRNPLAPIVNAAAILRLKVADDPELNWCREVIERQAGQLTRLVDDLLDVSRITRGNITLRPEEVDVATIVAAAVETCRPMIDARRHKLSVRLPEQPLVVSGDPARLTQVIANLLSNAAKYQDNEGRIELIVESVGQDAVVTVRDDGIGIAPEMLPLVFDLFSRVAGSGHRSDDGLGIGLALVKKLIEMHGGTIEAMSEGLTKGSQFVVRIPRLAGLGKPDGSGSKGTMAASFGGPPLRMLVVDDNRDAAESLAKLLRLGGHHVTVAHDGARALELAVVERPEFIFLDLGMPVMDGYDVCRQLRELGLSDARIIAVSGYGQERDKSRSEAAGFDAHAVKPIGLDEILRLLADCSTRRVS